MADCYIEQDHHGVENPEDHWGKTGEDTHWDAEEEHAHVISGAKLDYIRGKASSYNERKERIKSTKSHANAEGKKRVSKKRHELMNEQFGDHRHSPEDHDIDVLLKQTAPDGGSQKIGAQWKAVLHHVMEDLDELQSRKTEISQFKQQRKVLDAEAFLERLEKEVENTEAVENHLLSAETTTSKSKNPPTAPTTDEDDANSHGERSQANQNTTSVIPGYDENKQGDHGDVNESSDGSLSTDPGSHNDDNEKHKSQQTKHTPSSLLEETDKHVPNLIDRLWKLLHFSSPQTESSRKSEVGESVEGAPGSLLEVSATSNTATTSTLGKCTGCSDVYLMNVDDVKKYESVDGDESSGGDEWTIDYLMRETLIGLNAWRNREITTKNAKIMETRGVAGAQGAAAEAPDEMMTFIPGLESPYRKTQQGMLIGNSQCGGVVVPQMVAIQKEAELQPAGIRDVSIKAIRDNVQPDAQTGEVGTPDTFCSVLPTDLLPTDIAGTPPNPSENPPSLMTAGKKLSFTRAGDKGLENFKPVKRGLIAKCKFGGSGSEEAFMVDGYRIRNAPVKQGDLSMFLLNFPSDKQTAREYYTVSIVGNTANDQWTIQSKTNSGTKIDTPGYFVLSLPVTGTGSDNAVETMDAFPRIRISDVCTGISNPTDRFQSFTQFHDVDLCDPLDEDGSTVTR